MWWQVAGGIVALTALVGGWVFVLYVGMRLIKDYYAARERLNQTLHKGRMAEIKRAGERQRMKRERRGWGKR